MAVGLWATPSQALALSAATDARAGALLAKHRVFVGWQFGDGTFASMRITGNVTNEKGKRTRSSYETTYHILSYQEVLPGKKMISSYRVDDGKSIRSYTKFEPNVAVSDDDLHPPAPSASWTFGSSAPFPFKMTRDRMLVDATINGVKGRFLLDTGADAIVIDDRFASRAHLPILNSSDVGYMLYGKVKTRLRKIDTLTLGGSTLHEVVAFSQDFNKEQFGDMSGYDGLIGFDLAGAIVRLNVYDSTMAVLDPTTNLSAEKGLPVVVDLSQGTPIVPMVLNKTIPVNAMLDTGSPGLIFFGPDLISKRHFKVFAGCANIDTLAIGPIVYSGESACQFGMPADYMLLGFDFLKHFDFVFDYPHGRMFMHPNKN